MERVLIQTVGILFKGVMQVFINEAVQRETAEAEVQRLKETIGKMVQAQQSGSQDETRPAKVSRLPTKDAETGG